MGCGAESPDCDGWGGSPPPGVSCPPNLSYPPAPGPVEVLFVGWNPPGERHFWNDPRDRLRVNLTWVFGQLGWLKDEGIEEVFRRRRFYFVHAVRCWRQAEFSWRIPRLVETCAHANLEKDLARLRPRIILALGKLPHEALRVVWPDAIPKTLDYGEGWSGTVGASQVIISCFPNRRWNRAQRMSNRECTLAALRKWVARPFLLVGLTGGIASGKSTVSRQLAALGCHVIDADALAREVVAPGEPAWQAIVESFGPEVLQPDGALDRARLGALVFADAEKRRRLEAITHPAIQARRQALLGELAARGFDGLVVQDAALLVEVGAHRHVDRLVVVYATREVQLERLMRRDGLDRAEAERRLASQMPLAEKVRLAHYVIDNSNGPEETAAQVRAVHAALVAEHRARRQP